MRLRLVDSAKLGLYAEWPELVLPFQHIRLKDATSR
jgi:hypothetical protein